MKFEIRNINEAKKTLPNNAVYLGFGGEFPTDVSPEWFFIPDDGWEYNDLGWTGEGTHLIYACTPETYKKLEHAMLNDVYQELDDERSMEIEALMEELDESNKALAEASVLVENILTDITALHKMLQNG